MKIKNHSYVYLVKLLTFDQTKEGAFYYKIGKANSIPKRIKQFGPCELVKSIKCANPATALEMESKLHNLFSIHRKTDTEIFLLSEQVLALVVSQFANFESTAQACENS